MMAISEADVIQIRDLAIRLYLALDARDPNAYASVFTEDGEFVTQFMHLKGRSEIAGFLEQRIADGMTAGVRYFVTNQIVSEHPRGAHVALYLMQVNVADGPNAMGTGCFDAVAVADDGNWRFSRLELILDPTAPTQQPMRIKN